MDYKNLKRIVELITEHDLREFELEEEGSRLHVKRGPDGSETIVAAPAYAAPPPPPAAGPAMPGGGPVAEPAEPDDGLVAIKSPMVGTFYGSPSPEAKPYVAVGDEINDDTVVCIIEAMKVMNPLKAETSGVVRAILVENGDPVEYGQPLFKIQPS